MNKASSLLFIITLLFYCVMQTDCHASFHLEKDESFRLTSTAQWYLLDCSEKLSCWPALIDKEQVSSAKLFYQQDRSDRLQKAKRELKEKVEDKSMPNKAEQPIFQAY
ncbi:hypothetical protein Dthio_PD2971 [Desulfonatronospira thiodismutans ASO3-1]|uniref:Uncharacterized protein n=1 Tax=Desulfonatronospira thiodismutans ASO3-1 TaxID=555779 RepID=D6SLI6_9BACT|nr:hypothetical protein [Desulfonatronospira thiodismutans]EFI35547.1 hypothetical protein Dthio_PD2971 [Desulfonatronospira thiodismutans ASO3-1]